MTLIGNQPSNAVISPVTTNPLNPAFFPQTPAYLNGWVPYGAPYGAATYYKDGRGLVHLQGVITRPGGGGNLVVPSIAFTLPLGYRPALTETFFAWSNSPQWVSVDQFGTVTIGNYEPSTAWCNLSEVVFQTASGTGPTGPATVGGVPSNVEITDLESRVLIEPWQTLPLNVTGEWAAVGAGYQTPQYTRDVLGNVYLRGLLRLTVSNPNSAHIIGNVPSSYAMNYPGGTFGQEVIIGTTFMWPSGNSTQSVGAQVSVLSNPGSVPTPGSIFLRAAGNLTTQPAGLIVSLAGLSYPLN